MSDATIRATPHATRTRQMPTVANMPKKYGWCNQGYAWYSGGGICSKKADQPSWVAKTDCSCDYACNTATAHETAAKRRSLQKDKQTPKHGEAHILAPAEEHEGIIMAEH